MADAPATIQRRPTSFDALDPPMRVTNPDAATGKAFQEFPKHVYDLEDGSYIVVNSKDEEADALKDGYVLEAPAPKVEKAKTKAARTAAARKRAARQVSETVGD